MPNENDQNLEQMDKFEGANLGNIKTIKVVQFDKTTFSQNLNPIDFDNILIENGYNFEEIPFIFESSSFSDNENKSGAGMFFTKNVILVIPKLRSEVTAFLKNYENRKLLLLITDINNISHLAFPVRMSRNRSIPGKVSSLNNTTVEFSGDCKYESPIVTNVT